MFVRTAIVIHPASADRLLQKIDCKDMGDEPKWTVGDHRTDSEWCFRSIT